jgi:hypothetical protein
MQEDLFARMAAIPELRADGRPQDVAAFSDDEIYRWWLTRHFDNPLPYLDGETFADHAVRQSAVDCRPMMCCGLNPSTATATTDDQTIRKDIGFARRWGCGWFGKVNAYGYRATDPKDMKAARKQGVDIVGADNDRWLRHAFETAAVPMCLGTNGNGTPKHELYIPYERELVPWSCP